MVKVNVFVQPKKRRSPTPSPSEPQFTPAEAAPPRHRVNVFVAPHQGRSPHPHHDLDDGLDDDWETPPHAAVGGETSGGVQLWVSPSLTPPRHPWLGSVVTTMVWLVMTTGVVLGSWVALQLVVNPGSVRWLSWIFPEWSREADLHDQDAPKPLAELRAIAQAEGHRLGQPIPILSNGRARNQATLLIPVLNRDEELIELRVYLPEPGRREPHYRLGDRLSTLGPDEFYVTAPLVRVTTLGPGSSRRLPLDQVEVLNPQPPGAGLWLLLSGTHRLGRDRIQFGYIAHYDPRRQQVRLVMPWTSPAGERPQWSAILADATPELVINQSIGLEPNYLVYHLQNLDSATELAQLVPVSLQQNALSNASYASALLLAQQGLWSPALEILETVQQRLGDDWPSEAQNQLAVIRLHAEVTRRQAEQDWANPSQQVIAQVIDGRWELAWESLSQALVRDRSTLQLLRSDDNRLWRRVEAGARVSPQREAIQNWAVLRQYVRQGRPAAIAWLEAHNQAQGGSATLNARSRQILQAADTIMLTEADGQPSTGHFYGIATALSQIDANAWQQPNGSPPSLPPDHTWYRIQVEQAEAGDTWQAAPFSELLTPSTTPRYLWSQLGLGREASLQLITWDTTGQRQSTTAIAHALRWQNGTLEILAAAPSDALTASPVLAQTPATLVWQSPIQSIQLDRLAAQNPDQANRLAAALSAELQRVGRLPSTWQATGIAPFFSLGAWSVQPIDLTGNAQPDFILTLDTEAQNLATTSVSDPLDATNNPDSRPARDRPSQTVILSAQGAVLHSELGQNAGQRMVAIATLPRTPQPIIILRNGNQYQLRRWSP